MSRKNWRRKKKKLELTGLPLPVIHRDFTFTANQTDQLREQFEAYQTGLQRFISLQGVSWTRLEKDVDYLLVNRDQIHDSVDFVLHQRKVTMSGAGLRCCPVCGQTQNMSEDRNENRKGFWRGADFINGNIAEVEEHCYTCGLYAYDWSYGVGEERVGYVTFEFDYVNDDPQPNESANLLEVKAVKRVWQEEERKRVMEETRRLWNDPGARQWLEQAMHWPWDAWSNWGPFADWLELEREKQYPLNVKAIRGFCK